MCTCSLSAGCLPVGHTGTWSRMRVGSDIQGLYTVGLYNLIDRRRCHTLTQSSTQALSKTYDGQPWTGMSIRMTDVILNGTCKYLTSYGKMRYARRRHLLMGVILTVTSSATRHLCAMLHNKSSDGYFSFYYFACSIQGEQREYLYGSK